MVLLVLPSVGRHTSIGFFLARNLEEQYLPLEQMGRKKQQQNILFLTLFEETRTAMPGYPRKHLYTHSPTPIGKSRLLNYLNRQL